MDFQGAVIESVPSITHIAPPKDAGNIIDMLAARDRVILLPAKALGLCCSAMGARYATTTEVYPDSPRAMDEICIHAQVLAIVGASEYVLSCNGKSNE